MDYSQYYRKEKDGYSVYFPNRNGLDKNQIIEIFSQFGRVVSVNEAGDQYGLRFVRYVTLNEIIACLEGMRNHKLIKLSVQNKQYQTKPTKKYNKPKSNNGEQYTMHETAKRAQIEENLCMNKSNISISQMLEKESYIKTSITKNDEKMPSLVCIDDLNTSNSESSFSSSSQIHCVAPENKIISASQVVVANIPAALSIHYILHLFKKHDPISVSCMTKIPGRTSLRYCHVYFRKPEQAIAIEEEFDHFLILGHSLIVLRPNKLLEEIVSF